MPRHFLPKRSVLVAVLVALALLGLALPALIQARRESIGSAPLKAIQVKMAWKMRAADVTSFGFAPGGKYIYSITNTGKISVYKSDGALCYTASVPDADRIVLSPDGKYAVVYAHMNPANFDLVFLDSAGKQVWKSTAAGAVWSADACSIDRGARFVVGTGKRCVYVFDITRTAKHYRWWRTVGAVVSLNLDPDGENLTYGTWQESVIAKADIAGNVAWQRKLDSASLHYLQVLNTPDRMFLASMPNRRGVDGEFCVTSAVGEVLWQGAIDVSAQARVVYSPNGQYVCTGLVEVIQHKGKYISEKHAILYDGYGQQVWEQGSLFLQVDPLLVSAGGEVLLVDAKGALFIVRRGGDLEPGARLPGRVVRSAQSRDGASLLVKCSDGSLCKLDVVQ